VKQARRLSSIFLQSKWPQPAKKLGVLRLWHGPRQALVPVVVASPGPAAPDGPASITSSAVAGNSPAGPMASMRWFWMKTEA